VEHGLLPVEPALLPTASGEALPRPRTPVPERTSVQHAVPRRTSRILLAVASLIALAIGSFLIALYVSSTGSLPGPRDAAPTPHEPSQLTITPLEVDAAPIAPLVLDAAPVAPPIDAMPEMRVEIRTTPGNALIHIGGDVLYGPAKVELPAGHYDVVAELAGYRTEHRSLELAVGDHPILEIAFANKLPRIDRGTPLGRLTARTNPYSDVYENGKKLVQTPFADLELPAGVHTLSFKNPTHPTVTKTIKIVAGRETKLQFDLP
jgi:hypothetical protein